MTKNIMKPADFKGQESPYPFAHLEDGTCVSCWKLTWLQRLKVLVTGRVWMAVLNGHAQPPCYLAVNKPFKVE